MRSDASLALLLSLGLAATLGCSDKGGDTGGTGGDGGTAPCEDGLSTLAVAGSNNYSFDGALSIVGKPVAEGDITLDFSGLTTDLQLHDLDPVADIDAINLINFRYLSQEDVETALSENSLEQSDVSLFVNLEVEDRTSVQLSELGLLGNDIDVENYFNAAKGGTWLLTVNSGTTPGVGSLMTMFLEPGGGSDTTAVFEDSDTVLTYTVDLQSLTSPSVPEGSEFTVDWSGLTQDASGNNIASYNIDQILVGHYPDLTAGDLEGEFLDLELITDEQWHWSFSGGTSQLLSAATSEEGDFPGIDDTGTWVIALRCTTCANPAPPFLTVLTACEG